MGKGAVLSGLLHLAVVLLAVFGLPWLYDTNEVLQATATPISVISEAQFAELKNQKPPAQQKKPEEPKKQEIPPAPKAPDVAQPQPEPEEPTPPEPAAAEPAPQPPPPPEPPQQAEQQQPVVQPEPPPEPPQQAVAPEPPPQPKPEPVPPPEPQVAEAQPKPVPPKKPTPPKKKDEPKKKEDTKQKEKPKEEQVASDDFLKNIEKKARKNQQKSQPQPPPPQQAALPQDTYDGPPLSEGEKDMIREQVRANWITDGGMQGIEDMIVVLNVQMNPDGSVVSAAIDRSSSNGYPTWPIFADSCQRAVLKSSPLRMPPEKPYAAWRVMKLRFSARDLLGQ